MNRMKKFYSYSFTHFGALLVVTLWSVLGVGQTDYTLNSGSTGNSTTWGFIAINTGLQKGKSQYLVRASELTALGASTGNITHLAVNVSQQPGRDMNNFNIKLGTTSINTVDGNFQSTMTTVYSRNPQLRLALTAGGWRTFAFDTPYLWDGVSNLIVEICWDNGTSSTSGGGLAYHIPFNDPVRSSCYHTSSTNPACGYNASLGTTSWWRPQFRFTIAPLPVENTIFHNEGSTEQLVFDNFLGKFDNPLFRLSAPANVPSFNRFQIEINSAHDFSGTSFNQTFSGTYLSNSEYDLLCDNLSPAFLQANNVTYYVRARASHDGGTTWGGWTEDLYSFTYTSNCILDWYQTTKPQFDTDVLTNLKTNFAADDFVDLNKTEPTSFIGNTTVGTNCTGWADNRMVYTEVILTDPTVITHLNIRFSSVATGLGARYWQGIYDASGNLIVQIAQSTPVTGWNSQPTTTNPTLPPGTYYFAFMTASSSNCVTYEINVGTGTTFNNMLIYNNYAPSSFPTSITVPGSGSSTYKYNVTIGGAINQGYSLSSPISLLSFKNALSWDEVYWSGILNGGLITIQVMYDNSGAPTLIPDVDLPGNSVGFSVSGVNLSSLNTTTYQTLYLRLFLLDNGISPQLFSWGVSVIRSQQDTPDGIDGIGPICFGSNATLTAIDDPLDPGYDWAWYTGSCGGTLVGVGASITVSPSITTTYYLGVIDAAGCLVSDCISGTVTLPTVGTTLAINNDVAVCLVNSNNFVHFYEPSGRLLASINSNGQNLGNVTMTTYVDGAPALVPACDDPTDPQYMTHVMQRHWVITPQFQPSGDVIVRLPFDDNGAGGEYQTLRTAANGNANGNDDIVDYASIVLSKYAGPLNVNNNALDNCPASGGNGGTELFTQSSVSGLQVNSYLTGFQPTAKYADFEIGAFSEFWLHGSMNDSPLPVTLTSLYAECESSSLRNVVWTTASEQNSSHFNVQRSIDGYNWSLVEKIDAASNSTTENHYNVLDRIAVSEIVYYRLNQVDLDGVSTVYGPIAVTCDASDKFNVFPNPTSTNVTVVIPTYYVGQGLSFNLYNVEGKLISVNIQDDLTTNQIDINMEELSKGMYILQVASMDKTIERIKLIKQ